MMSIDWNAVAWLAWLKSLWSNGSIIQHIGLNLDFCWTYPVPVAMAMDHSQRKWSCGTLMRGSSFLALQRDKTKNYEEIVGVSRLHIASIVPFIDSASNPNHSVEAARERLELLKKQRQSPPETPQQSQNSSPASAVPSPKTSPENKGAKDACCAKCMALYLFLVSLSCNFESRS